MRKIFITFAFVAIAMLAFNKGSTASTTIDFNMNLTDNGGTGCSVPYNGYYYIRVHIIVDGSEICQHSQNNVTSGLNDITWVCDVDLSQYSNYTVTIDICRFSFPNIYTCCTSNSKYNINMAQLTNGLWTDNITI
jgi:hypothetical protein